MAARGIDAQVKELASLLVHRLDELGRDVTSSVRSNVEFYKANRVVSDQDLLESTVDNIRFLFGSLTAGDPFDTSPAVVTGTKRAAAGVPLPGVMAAFRVASHTLWDTMVEVADGHPEISRDAVLQATAMMWQAQDVYTDAMADAYRRQSVQMAINDEAERSALTEALLQTRLSDDRSLWEIAQMLRLPQKGPFVVIAAVCPQIGKQALPGIAAILRSVDVFSAWRLLPDTQVGIAHVPSKAEHSAMLDLLNRVAVGRIGVSPQFDDLADTAQALRYARVATSAHSGAPTGTTVFEDSVLAVAAVSAPEMTDKVAQIVLGAFDDLGADERAVLFDTFRRWVQNKGSMATTAEQLYCHPNTVRYRLHRIEERTGRSLSVPNELAELCLAFEIRSRTDPEYELLDTGVFDDDRYWVVDVRYAKAAPTDILMTVAVTNTGPQTELLHVLPTIWYRNTWSWDPDVDPPRLAAADDDDTTVAVEHPFLGDLELLCGPGPRGSRPELRFCDNETNTRRLFGAADGPRWPKDGINDHVVAGADTVNPRRTGTKCAAWYQVSVPAGQTVELRVRLRPAGSAPEPATALGGDFTQVRAQRLAEADELYAELTPAAASSDEAAVMRQAFAGLLWSKQCYHYDVARWLDGDPGLPPPPSERRHGRNSRWRNFEAFDVMSMPDTWEYPWFGAWDLAFHCVALVHVDPVFAKYQLSLLCREWFQHPTGALPAYEWDFGDVNPPVQAWAALEVFAIDGGRDFDFLSRIFDKLLVNFTWWVNREDANGSNLFEGGFMGLDNIGPIDRSHLPVHGILEQSDATGWMATYALSMATIAAILHGSGRRAALDLVEKFLEHFAGIAEALDTLGLWDDHDGLFYDRLLLGDGAAVSVRVRSMVAMIPPLAAAVVNEEAIDRTFVTDKMFADYLRRHGLGGTEEMADAGILRGEPGRRRLLVGVTDVDRVRRLCGTLFDPAEFLSPHGLRSLSTYHRDHPYVLDVAGLRAGVDYEPAESTTAMFGGNSNWRGPVWFPLNYLVAATVERYHEFFGDDFTVEYPTGSGHQVTLDVVADDLWGRLVSLFVRDGSGRRPCFGGFERMQTDPRWRDNLLFHEYFHGDNGAGLGASHQTGWTGLVADVIRRRHRAYPSVSAVIGRLVQPNEQGGEQIR